MDEIGVETMAPLRRMRAVARTAMLGAGVHVSSIHDLKKALREQNSVASLNLECEYVILYLNHED